jgi:hypothetical protein
MESQHERNRSEKIASVSVYSIEKARELVAHLESMGVEFRVETISPRPSARHRH